MRKFFKGLGFTLLGLVALIAIAALVLIPLGGSRADRQYEAPANSLIESFSTDPVVLARGEHFADILACKVCHGQDLAGKVMIDAPPFLVVADNLTPAGLGATFSPRDWDRAIRHGIGADGRAAMPMMPAALFYPLDDTDTQALISYLATLPPIENDLPESALRPLGKILVATGALGIEAEVNGAGRSRRAAPPRAPDAAYGAYLASVSCVQCHGENLAGGPHPEPDGPWSPSLAASASWDGATFDSAMRTGDRPDDAPMDIRFMPWGAYAELDALEMAAIRAHIAALFP